MFKRQQELMDKLLVAMLKNEKVREVEQELAEHPERFKYEKKKEDE